MQTKGFALLDVLLTLVVLSIFVLLSATSYVSIDEEYYTFESNYLLKQSEAMLNSKNIELNEDVRFNEKGNVNQARTVLFSTTQKLKEIIVELGGGRLVYKE